MKDEETTDWSRGEKFEILRLIINEVGFNEQGDCEKIKKTYREIVALLTE